MVRINGRFRREPMGYGLTAVSVRGQKRGPPWIIDENTAWQASASSTRPVLKGMVPATPLSGGIIDEKVIGWAPGSGRWARNGGRPSCP